MSANTYEKKIGAMLVAGGGIGGMQAALDAAEIGFKVYLVERDISIGGVMAQLDKTFPTNDCSICMLSPKLIEVARHPNIDIITQAELTALEGEAGCFTATVRQEPRFVDPNLCNACGMCAEVCPVTIPSSFDEGLGTRKAIYCHFPQAIPAAFAIKKLDRAPCTLACPAKINVQGYVQLIKMGKYEEAVRLIMERLPLPGVLGRICPHPCEDKCRRRDLDEAVAICSLKRFAADRVDLAKITPPPVAARPEKVAIIGSGPAGLTCAYHLALKGYRPLILEALDKAGGMLRMGIPDYRLPKEVLDREIDNILRLGVTLKTNTVLGRDFTLDGLFDEGYQAVFLGLGRLRPPKKYPAIGQEAALGALADWGIAVSQKDTIIVDETTYQTSREGVFAAGDAQTGPRITIKAVAGGIEAAESIDRYLRGVDLKKDRELSQPSIREGRWSPMPEKGQRQPRVAMAHLPVEKSREGLTEVNIGFTEAQALSEAARCLNCGVCSECMECVAACQAGAVDHRQKAQTRSLQVGAVILAPGFRPFDARLKPEYGHGRYPNVLTSLEFERVLSATGPFGGHVKRPSDGVAPRKVAWIQCVGSRDASIGREYCSYVCCMFAAKQAIVAKEHEPEINPAIFYLDFRAQGKGFDSYYQRAREVHGVRFIRSMVSRVAQDPRTHNLEITYADERGNVQTEEFDLVILSVGLSPHPAAKKLAEVCGVDTDKYGFAVSPPFELVSTSREGVYTCGAFQSPKDIPETVSQAAAAVGAAAALLAEARGTVISVPEYPSEREVAAEAPRLGVFVCHCGTNIAGVVNVIEVTEYAKTLPHVVYADHYTFACATDSLEKMRRVIQTEGLNRVVVASCSPHTHEGLFQDNLQKSGLNKYLFEMANIRDQDSWVHQSEPALATEKAKELVKMSVARAAVLEPLEEIPFQVTQSALVVGNGLAALTAALTIADAGYQVDLAAIEDGFASGGIAYKQQATLEGQAIKPYIDDIVQRIDQHPRIRWWPKTKVTKFAGSMGKFRSILAYQDKQRDLQCGVVVIATGGVEYKPSEYLYGQHPRVLTQMDLESLLAADPGALGEQPTIVMIQCVGSRESGHSYCSRICCGQAIKNAVNIKKRHSKAQVYILYRDMRTYGLKELYYLKARQAGIRFIRYEAEQKPEVTGNGEGLRVEVWDQNLGCPVALRADYVVLSTAIRPHPLSKEIAHIFKLPTDADGFFMEAHLKLRPLDFAARGVYLCGLAHGPKYVEESIAQAQGAAARALTILSKKQMWVGGAVACVDPQKCVFCLTCLRTCPFGVPRVDHTEGVVEIDPAACQGCGSCASACPRKAIEVRHQRDSQFISQIAAIGTA
jgi:heterodisulfide reductase subunit A-like polyferredoxin